MPSCLAKKKVSISKKVQPCILPTIKSDFCALHCASVPCPRKNKDCKAGPSTLWACPDSVVILQFGKWFDQSLAGVSLPCGLQELRFGTKFNEPLDNVDLPGTLQTLELGSGFQQSLRMLSCPKAFKLSDADRRAALSACSRQSYFVSRISAFNDCVRYVEFVYHALCTIKL